MDIPTQFPTQGQWWSNLAMQRLHTAQCLDLMGFRICKATKTVKRCPANAHIVCKDRSFPARVTVYQAGTAEYAQIQAARLCQLHNCLEEGNEKQKQDLKKKKKNIAEKCMNN